MTTQQRMEKQFFIHFISLINEVQGKQTLQSQIHSNKKSTWIKQTKSQRQDQSALGLRLAPAGMFLLQLAQKLESGLK